MPTGVALLRTLASGEGELLHIWLGRAKRCGLIGNKALHIEGALLAKKLCAIPSFVKWVALENASIVTMIDSEAQRLENRCFR